jgi:hypothetical protein
MSHTSSFRTAMASRGNVRMTRHGKRHERYKNIYLVVSGDNSIITVAWRN